MSAFAFKRCPKCQSPSELQAGFCAMCGHQFSTRFHVQQPSQPTQMFIAGDIQPPPTGGLPLHGAYGVPSKPGEIRKSHNHAPWWAVTLNLCLAGPGQMYNGQWIKGFVILGIYVGAAAAHGSDPNPATAAAFSVLIILTWVIAQYDALRAAYMLKTGATLNQWNWG